jgi:pimeloyl-ACP methyl ester carboxylesterase
VSSLTVSEPGALALAQGVRAVDEALANGARLYAAREELDPGTFLRMFRSGVHSAHDTPDELPDWLEHGARLAMAERAPWEADVPLAELAAARFPKLVISGGHSPVFEAVCDTLAERIGAERQIITGRGHTIPTIGAPYNDCLEDFLRRADAGAIGDDPQPRHEEQR